MRPCPLALKAQVGPGRGGAARAPGRSGQLLWTLDRLSFSGVTRTGSGWRSPRQARAGRAGSGLDPGCPTCPARFSLCGPATLLSLSVLLPSHLLEEVVAEPGLEAQ